MNCGLLLLDDRVRITYANKVAQEWFGPSDQIMGESCYEVFKLKEEECVGLKALQTG